MGRECLAGSERLQLGPEHQNVDLNTSKGSSPSTQQNTACCECLAGTERLQLGPEQQNVDSEDGQNEPIHQIVVHVNWCTSSKGIMEKMALKVVKVEHVVNRRQIC